jgi:hypothetical protein
VPATPRPGASRAPAAQLFAITGLPGVLGDVLLAVAEVVAHQAASPRSTAAWSTARRRISSTLERGAAPRAARSAAIAPAVMKRSGVTSWSPTAAPPAFGQVAEVVAISLGEDGGREKARNVRALRAS